MVMLSERAVFLGFVTIDEQKHIDKLRTLVLSKRGIKVFLYDRRGLIYTQARFCDLPSFLVIFSS